VRFAYCMQQWGWGAWDWQWAPNMTLSSLLFTYTLFNGPTPALHELVQRMGVLPAPSWANLAEVDDLQRHAGTPFHARERRPLLVISFLTSSCNLIEFVPGVQLWTCDSAVRDWLTLDCYENQRRVGHIIVALGDFNVRTSGHIALALQLANSVKLQSMLETEASTTTLIDLIGGAARYLGHVLVPNRRTPTRQMLRHSWINALVQVKRSHPLEAKDRARYVVVESHSDYFTLGPIGFEGCWRLARERKQVPRYLCVPANFNRTEIDSLQAFALSGKYRGQTIPMTQKLAESETRIIAVPKKELIVHVNCFQ
jgi:hypothetical protein